jgi:hypothetical protein
VSSIILVGLFGVLLALFFKKPIIETLGENNRLVHKLTNATWFQNQWLSGIFLFAVNGVLFSITCLVLYGLTYLHIPFVHILVMFAAVIGSISLWIIINKAWGGSKGNRLKMGAIGSSFYLILIVIFVYLLVTLKPAFPGDDTFMRALGLEIAIIVTTVAWITCFIITGFSKKESGRWTGI